MRIPDTGLDPAEVLVKLESFRANDVRWQEGKTFAHAFIATDEARDLAERACTLFLWENGLDPTLFPSLVRMENEVVAMAAAHLGGDVDVVGNFTSGGTESVLLAVKTARDRARAMPRKIERPEMVLPITAHPCFFKAAHYFEVTPVVVSADPVTFKADVRAMREAISPRTVLLAASAPSYAHGVIDPIAAIGELALERSLLFHVDGCVGAFLLPFFEALGAEVTPFDFRVPGVTSISMDFHKYAFAPKGSSVVLYRNADIRRHQLFSWSAWPGYTLLNSTIQSSKSGGPLAATWAMLTHFGRDGYLRETRRLKEATDAVRAAVSEIDELHVLGRPEMCLVAIGAHTISVFRLCDEMSKRGWHMYPQLRVGDLKESCHLTILPSNVEHIAAWADDLRACVQIVRKQPPSARVAELKAAIGDVDFTDLTPAEVEGLLEAAGLRAGSLPEVGMADINEVLNDLPPAVIDLLLTVYYNRLSGNPGAVRDQSKD